MCDFFFGEFHRHTAEGSKRDGYGSAEAGVAAAVKKGYKGLAVTDHGSMSAVVKHYLACKKAGIKPIIGIEGYAQEEYNPSKEFPYFHTTLLAKNMTGYQNLCRLTTVASEHQPRLQGGASAATRGYIPIFTSEDMKEYHEGVILLSGCISGIIPQLFLSGKPEEAERLLRFYKEIFEDDFYLEVMPNPVIKNGTNIQKEYNEWAIRKGRQYDILVVGTTDSHMPDKGDYPTYLKMWEVSRAKPSTDYSRLYLHTGEEWAASWKDMMGFRGEQFLETTWDIAEKCNVDLTFTDMKPKVDWGEPSEERLERICVQSLEEKGLWDWDGRDETWEDSKYVKEMVDELEIVKETGFIDYFLTVEDFCRFLIERGIVFAARGSANGFLLTYLLGISMVDPIKYGTYPFRFLRRDKKDVDPDIDLDVASRGRKELLDYVLERFAGRSAPISNFQYWKTKALVNEMLKTYPDMNAADKEAIKSALINCDYDNKRVGYDRLFEDEVYGQFFLDFTHRHPDFLIHFCNLHGQLMQYGKHAGGVVITNEEAWKYLPMSRMGKESDEEGYALQTAYNMEDLANMRLMKYDILGLGEHQHIGEVQKMVGCTFRDEIVNDTRIYDAFCELKTEAVFQSGTSLAQKMFQHIMPRNFSEVCVAISMNRPGPYTNGLLKNFIDGKHGKVDKSLPWYEICKETYGAIVYQEHAMLICVQLAGMSMPHADKFVKGISKKKIMPELHQEFVEGLQRVSGIGEEQAQKLYKALENYSFNKNHAVGYALLAVYGMWLKLNYPYEFYCAALRKKDKSKKGADALEMLEAAFYRDTSDPRPGFSGLIFAPNVNGTANYSVVTVEDQKFLQQGLTNIDGVGPKAAVDICSHGPYQEPDLETDDVEEWLKAWQKVFKEAGVAGRSVSMKTMYALFHAGALETNEDRIYNKADAQRSRLIHKYEWRWRKAKQIADKEKERQKEWESSHERLTKAI